MKAGYRTTTDASEIDHETVGRWPHDERGQLEAERMGEAGARAARRRSRQERGDRLDLASMTPACPRIHSIERLGTCAG